MKKPKGKLYTSNPNGIKKITFNAEIWQITRGGPTIPDTIVVDSLAPSKDLFKKYTNEWKGKSPEVWWKDYEEQFMSEMKTEEKLQCLRLIYKKLLKRKNIILVCFCKDHRYCHRRLLGEFLKQYNVEVKELNPLKHEQPTLFKEWSH